jgi:hypothetical protein
MNGVSNHRNPYILGKPIHEPDSFLVVKAYLALLKITFFKM